MQSQHVGPAIRGGINASIQGFATSIGPLLLFTALFGPQSLPAALWATLITASLAHVAHLALRGHATLVPSARVASLAAYSALVLQLAHAAPGAQDPGGWVSMQQFQSGLAAASALYLMASCLVLLAGALQLGNVFKLIPTPVVSGIGNGTALLLVWLATRQLHTGAAPALLTATVMLGSYLGWPALQRLVPPLHHLPAAVPALIAGVLSAGLVEPVLTAPLAVWDTTLWGWSGIALWSGMEPSSFGRLLLLGLPGGMTLALLMTLETFTTLGLMESRFGAKIDANRELLATGGANLFSALLGGVPCTASPIRSVSQWVAGGRTAWSGLICLGLTTALVVSLGSWLLVLPAGMVAGLFLMQSTLVADHSFFVRIAAMRKARQWPRLTGQDLGLWLSFLIALLAFFGNLVWACFMGIGLSCLLVLRRVSGNLTARWAYLDQYHSHRIRSPGEEDYLARHAHQVAVLRLTGHLFFGNSARLTQLAEEIHPQTKTVVIDVSQVIDLDPSAEQALVTLFRNLTSHCKPVIITGVRLTQSLEVRELVHKLENVLECQDLDRGLEQCESSILVDARIISPWLLRLDLVKNALLQDLAPDEVTTVLLMGEMHEIAKRTPLFDKHAAADGIWLIEEGRVSILASADPNAARLTTCGPGQFVGEMAFIDNQPRSAAAMADTPVKALRLSEAALNTLVQEHPELALKLTRNIARQLSRRVRQNSAVLTDSTPEVASYWANSTLGNYAKF